MNRASLKEIKSVIIYLSKYLLYSVIIAKIDKSKIYFYQTNIDQTLPITIQQTE